MSLFSRVSFWRWRKRSLFIFNLIYLLAIPIYDYIRRRRKIGEGEEREGVGRYYSRFIK